MVVAEAYYEITVLNANIMAREHEQRLREGGGSDPRNHRLIGSLAARLHAHDSEPSLAELVTQDSIPSILSEH